MRVLRCKSAVLVLVFSPYLAFFDVTSAECDLEKIFRTPKDMSRVNFDHFEIVERNGFDRWEPTTTSTSTERPSPSTTSTKKNGPNVANAQVLVRFGGDDVHGSNHIMKIPPQCRHLVGNSQADPPDLYYPPSWSHRYQPPCSSHYYHPYPPPVPYVFPNYYFCNYGDEPPYLPPQLREYLSRHPECLGERYPSKGSEVFVRRRPAMRGNSGDYGLRADLVNVRNPSVKAVQNPNIEDPENVHLSSSVTKYPGVVLMRPRILKPLDLSNEDIEEHIAKKDESKRDCADVQKATKENAKVKNDREAEEKNEIVASSEEKRKKHERKPKDSKNKIKKSKPSDEDDLEELLHKALVAAYKCQNCTEPPKMLVSYPIINRLEDEKVSESNSTLSPSSCPHCGIKPGKFANDIDGLGVLNTADIRDDCKCVNCQCNKKTSGRKFANDIDDLIAVVVAGIIDPTDDTHPDFVPPSPRLTQVDLDLGDADYTNNGRIPLKPTFNLDLGACDSSVGYRRASTQGSTSSFSQIGDTPPKISHSQCSIASGAGYRTDPDTILLYREPTNVEVIDVEEDSPIAGPRIEYRKYGLPARKLEYASPQNPIVVPNWHLPSVDDTQYPPNRPLTYCFFPEPNVSLLRPVPKRPDPLPKYLRVIPRDDLEIVSPPSDSRTLATKVVPDSVPSYCRRCGHNYIGGNFCDNCGLPAPTSYCPTCARETRQLADW